MQKTALVPYAHLPRAHRDRHVLTSTVDVFGTAHWLLAERAPQPRGDLPPFDALVVSVHPDGTVELSELSAVRARWPQLDRLPDGGFVVAASRARRDEEANQVQVFDALGRDTSSFSVGDAIEHLLVDKAGHIWVGHYSRRTPGTGSSANSLTCAVAGSESAAQRDGEFSVAGGVFVVGAGIGRRPQLHLRLSTIPAAGRCPLRFRRAGRHADRRPPLLDLVGGFLLTGWSSARTQRSTTTGRNWPQETGSTCRSCRTPSPLRCRIAYRRLTTASNSSRMLPRGWWLRLLRSPMTDVKRQA